MRGDGMATESGKIFDLKLHPIYNATIKAPKRGFPVSIQRLDQGPRLSHGVLFGDIVYLAGQVCEGATVADQTRGVLAQIDDLLSRAGSSKAHLLTAMVWLADMGDFDQMNTVWDAWVAGVGAPTRATGQVRLPNPNHKVEIIITAVRM
jgi:enamine deaminase RidA (YjgF/YER057c/UK114 family)